MIRWMILRFFTGKELIKFISVTKQIYDITLANEAYGKPIGHFDQDNIMQHFKSQNFEPKLYIDKQFTAQRIIAAHAK